MPRRVLVIGLDCASPHLVFDRFRDVMPNTSRLMESGSFGLLRSSAPPITVPAWTCMVSGRDPGELGLYGFRNRLPNRPTEYKPRVATSEWVQEKRLWDWLSDAGKSVASLFVPLTWPPTPVRGHLVSCFLTPDLTLPWAFPTSFEHELTNRFGPYIRDVTDFRASDKPRIYDALKKMTAQHFNIARYVWEQKIPDFMMFVDMAPDRFHHAFWSAFDPAHPRYIRGNRFEHLGREFYGFLDQNIGALLESIDEDTTVMIVSDHGARALHGSVCINEWLRDHGWLKTHAQAADPNLPHSTSIHEGVVDWSRTKAWGEGGYYARIWLNVAGREPHGIVAPADWANERARLKEELLGLVDSAGTPIPVRIDEPEREYRATRGFAPDLLVYFDDLAYRAAGTLGHGQWVIAHDDRSGPGNYDECNHDWDGLWILSGRGAPREGRVNGARIYDVARTVLELMETEAPNDLLGRSLVSLSADRH